MKEEKVLLTQIISKIKSKVEKIEGIKNQKDLDMVQNEIKNFVNKDISI